MEFQFPWPMTQGEWLAWSSAAVTILFGLIMLFLPRLGLRILRLQPVPSHPEAVSEARATMAGFYLGVGISCIVMAQIWLYLALGLSWLFTAFGRMVSMLSDGGNTPYNWISVIIELALATMALGYGLGLIV
jgi:uncharacterized membrane protein HdeD (DUF308 family)